MVDRQLEHEIELLHSRICQALADPKRVLILYLLAEGPLRVGELVDRMDVPQPTASRHLAVLRERRLVQAERDGTADRVFHHTKLHRKSLSSCLESSNFRDVTFKAGAEAKDEKQAMWSL